MTDAITEIVYLPLKPNLNLESGEKKKVLDDTLDTIASQHGLKSLVWGRQIENPDMLEIVVDWEHIDNHKLFQDSPAYQPFLDRLDTMLSGAPIIFHAKIPAGEAGMNPLDAKVTECVSAYFPPDHDEDKYTNGNWNAFHTEIAKVPNVEIQATAGGWSIERHQHVALGEGVEGKMFAAFIGWPSVDAHMAFRKTPEFAAVIPLFREGIKGTAVHHVGFERRV